MLYFLYVSGQCICQHNTAGSNCELCSRGYYGYPLKQTPDDCKPCPCPDNGPCILMGDNPDPICSECPNGRTGKFIMQNFIYRLPIKTDQFPDKWLKNVVKK